MSDNAAPTDVDALAAHIQQHLSAQASPMTASSLIGGIADAKTKFCQIWPDVRQGLTVLQTVITLIPGIGVIAKTAISTVITVGDAVSKAICD